MAYTSDETGRNEVFVRAFRADGPLGPPAPMTRTGGWRPHWSRDGKSIFCILDERIMAVEVAPETAAPASEPRMVLDLNSLNALEPYSILPDERIAVIQKGEEENEITQVNVVFNWLDEFKNRQVTGTNR